MNLLPDTDLSELLSISRHPMVVVTARHGDERAGCLVGFTTQCSIKPIRFLVCLSKANHTFGLAQRVDVLAVHHLASDNMDLAELFGGETGDDIDKFERSSWTDHEEAVTLDDVSNWWIGHVRERIPLGDHEGFLLEPATVHVSLPFTQLESTDVQHITAGHDRSVES